MSWPPCDAGLDVICPGIPMRLGLTGSLIVAVAKQGLRAYGYSVHPFSNVPICLNVTPPVCDPVRVFIHPYIHACIHPVIHPPIQSYIYEVTHPSMQSSIHPCSHTSIYAAIILPCSHTSPLLAYITHAVIHLCS